MDGKVGNSFGIYPLLMSADIRQVCTHIVRAGAFRVNYDPCDKNLDYRLDDVCVGPSVLSHFTLTNRRVQVQQRSTFCSELNKLVRIET